MKLRSDGTTCAGQTAHVAKAAKKEGTEKPRQYHCTGWKKKRNDVLDGGKVVKGRTEAAGRSHIVPETQPRWNKKQAVESKVGFRRRRPYWTEECKGSGGTLRLMCL